VLSTAFFACNLLSIKQDFPGTTANALSQLADKEMHIQKK